MGNQPVLEVCFSRNKDSEDVQGAGHHPGGPNSILKLQSPCYKKILRESGCGNAFSSDSSLDNLIPLSSEESTVPFSKTHITTFKRMVFDKLQIQQNYRTRKFVSLAQLKKLCMESAGSSAWQSEASWESGAGLEKTPSEESDLVKLLKMFYLPLRKGDELIPLSSLISLALVLCKGSNYDKAKFLFSFIEERTGEQMVYRTNQDLQDIIESVIDFCLCKSLQFYSSQAAQGCEVSEMNLCSSTEFLSEKSRRQATDCFLNTLFSNLYCLSKVDFMVMIQSPPCHWIFDEESTRRNLHHHIWSSLQQCHSTPSTAFNSSISSPESCQMTTLTKTCSDKRLDQSHRSDEEVHAKMVESQDELQFCQTDEGIC